MAMLCERVQNECQVIETCVHGCHHLEQAWLHLGLGWWLRHAGAKLHAVLVTRAEARQCS
jgi:hypothetical protein